MINIRCEIDKKTKSFKVIDIYSSRVVFSLLDVEVEDKRLCNFEINDDDKISIDEVAYPLSFTLNGSKRYKNVFDIGALFDTLKDLKNNKFEFNVGEEKDISKKGCVIYLYEVSDTSSPLDFKVYAKVNEAKNELINMAIKESRVLFTLSKEEFDFFYDNLVKFLKYIRFETIRRICFDKVYIKDKKLFAIQKRTEITFLKKDIVNIVYKKSYHNEFKNNVVRKSAVTIVGIPSSGEIYVDDKLGHIEKIKVEDILFIDKKYK